MNFDIQLLKLDDEITTTTQPGDEILQSDAGEPAVLMLNSSYFGIVFSEDFPKEQKDLRIINFKKDMKFPVSNETLPIGKGFIEEYNRNKIIFLRNPVIQVLG